MVGSDLVTSLMDLLNPFLFRKHRALPCLRTPSIKLVLSNLNVGLHQFAVHLDRNDVTVLYLFLRSSKGLLLHILGKKG